MTAKESAVITRIAGTITGDWVYEIVTDQGKMRVSIPEAYRVTYGPISPGTKGGYSAGAMCLRVYEDTTHQRMLISNVLSFRDTSLPVLRAAVRKAGSYGWLPDTAATYKHELAGVKGSDLERDWVDESELVEDLTDVAYAEGTTSPWSR